LSTAYSTQFAPSIRDIISQFYQIRKRAGDKYVCLMVLGVVVWMIFYIALIVVPIVFEVYKNTGMLACWILSLVFWTAAFLVIIYKYISVSGEITAEELNIYAKKYANEGVFVDTKLTSFDGLVILVYNKSVLNLDDNLLLLDNYGRHH
jgi:hypothetical protein